MIHLKDYKLTNRNVSFYNLSNIVEKYNINLYEEKELVPTLVKLSNDWNVPYNKIIDFVMENKLYKELFDYNIHKYGKLVAERAVYTEKRVWNYGVQNLIKTYYDVYVSENNYFSLEIPKIVEWIITEYYPFCAIFKKATPYEGIEIDDKMRIDEFARIHWDKHLTMGDIINIIKNPKMTKKELAYNLYGDCDIIFLPIHTQNVHGHNYDISLYIPREAIVKKDWSVVENQILHSIIKPNANNALGKDKNNWFEGKQKFNPYWDCEKVKIVKELWDKVLK